MRKNTVPVFIDKTWEMLQDNGNCLIVRWRPDGNSFEITDETLFIEQVLPRYFKHANFSSFIRQLNMYNFHKRKTTEGPVQFRHKLFRRNQQQLLIGIKRKPSEADLRLGDELIRRLAPECIEENLSDSGPKEEEPEPSEQLIQEELDQLEKEPGFSRIAFGTLSWNENGGQFNRWSMQKKIKTMILKNPPLSGCQNRGF